MNEEELDKCKTNVALVTAINTMIDGIKKEVSEKVIEGRERSLSITKLDEAKLWLSESVVKDYRKVSYAEYEKKLVEEATSNLPVDDSGLFEPILDASWKVESEKNE